MSLNDPINEAFINIDKLGIDKNVLTTMLQTLAQTSQQLPSTDIITTTTPIIEQIPSITSVACSTSPSVPVVGAIIPSTLEVAEQLIPNGDFVIMGYSINKKYVYLAGIIVLAVLGYLIWNWYQNRNNVRESPNSTEKIDKVVTEEEEDIILGEQTLYDIPDYTNYKRHRQARKHE